MTRIPLLLALALPGWAEHGLPEMAQGREAGVRFLGCEVLSLSRILAEVSALSGSDVRPWHHNYRANGLPRPDHRLDFAAEREAQLERAHHELHTEWRR
jgi:hypothetical protein